MTDATKNLCDFLDASPTPYHAADNIKAYLAAHGAIELHEKDAWNLEPGAAYYVGRGSSAVVAFRPGLRPFGTEGFIMAGAHTDSPCLKIRRGAERATRSMLRIAVEVYGGAILSGWLDRPLALAGRVFLRGEGGLREVLYSSGHPVGVIPNLPIHLNREINKGFEYNPHQHLPVLVETAGIDAKAAEAAQGGVAADGDTWLARLAAADLGVGPEAVVAPDRSDVAAPRARAGGRPRAGGLQQHAILEAFGAAPPTSRTQVACFLDAEEVGSMTAQGAASSFVRDMLARINLSMNGSAEDVYRAAPRSLCVSVDGAQAWNPAYPEKFDEGFSPLLGKGPAVKMNANQRYATDALAAEDFADTCHRAGAPFQAYMARADIQPGTTIGPISSSRLGVRTIDVGHPLLAMHAIRETIEGSDHRAMIEVLREFFKEARPS